MPEPSFIDIIRRKSARLESIPDAFISAVERDQRQILSGIIELFAGLDTKSGKILMSEANLSAIESIGANLRAVMLESKYIESLTKFAKEFDIQGELNDTYFFKAFPKEFEVSAIADAVLQARKQQVIDLLIESPIDTEFILPIKEQLLNAVSSGASLTDTIKGIREFVAGTPEKDGKLLSYSKQIAYDGFALADRSYTNAIADELDAEWFYYSGGLLKTSRPFCERFNNKYFSKRQIENFGEGLDETGKTLPEKDLLGRIEGTNKNSIFVTAGGYNCRHSWMPVSVFLVPKDVIRQNIELGYITLSKTEAALVGL